MSSFLYDSGVFNKESSDLSVAVGSGMSKSNMKGLRGAGFKITCSVPMSNITEHQK